ncbi:hypothetical protein QTG54_004761 [Skeletonema marinoi]|uniref:Uncharacterized protein n=1 Tax=Skeletonema marinoi TaxID=267567 RepID=A0AAD8YEA0_9STRA|nr:hypothetical protein QTG54_004761 [Skeletonema marinoi]
MDLDGTNVTGDVRDIKETDFTNLNEMFLSKSVYGSNVYCEFDCIADVPSVMQAWHRLSKRIPSLFEKIRQWYLDLESTDQYHSEYHNYGVDPPFYIEPVKVGPRLGWRWINYQKHPCKVNWLDPEPEIPSENDYGARVKYESYVRDLQDIELELQASPFKDCYLPTEEEYCRLSKEFDENRVFSDEEDDSCGE